MKRTPEQLKEHYLAKVKAIEDKKHLKHKVALMRIARELSEVGNARQDRTIQQAATSIQAAANAIPVQIPQ